MKDKILNWFKKLVENTPQLIGNKYIKYIAFYLILVYLGFTVMFVYGWIHNLNVTNEADLPIIISFLTFFVSGSTVYAITFLAKLFIDKNNNKKYSLIPFSYEFIISTINAIEYNDYVVNFDPNYHKIYVCFDFSTMEKIRMAINKSKDKFFKKYAWI